MAELTKTEPSRNAATAARRAPLVVLRDEMDDLLSRFFGGEDGWFAGRIVPTVDLAETDEAVLAKLDLPGVNPDEIDISISGNLLTVRGERKEEKEEKGKTFHRIERRTGAFSRSLTLPCAVNEDEVAAEYKDGVLAITLPKCEEAKSHKIKVKH
jgi:HSP20 family protein